MVYNNKLVAVIKVNGKILREQNGEVFIPFGAEYSIALKNLNSVKATASISVDGTDVMSGYEVIVPPNSEVELEGFMKGNKVSNKFKFIEKTKAISDYRGDKISDGLVRISFKFERQLPVVTNWPQVQPITWYSSRGAGDIYLGSEGSTCNFNSGSAVYGVGGSGGGFVEDSRASVNMLKSASFSTNADGITVKGSKSNQIFAAGNVGVIDPTEYVIVLQLKGQVKTKPVATPVTVRSKVKCETCGRLSKSFSKFCPRCGTALF